MNGVYIISKQIYDESNNSKKRFRKKMLYYYIKCFVH